MSEIIEMPYGTGKTIGFWRTICLTSYPPQYRYECSNCHSQVKEPGSSCPNCQTEMKSEMEALTSEFVKNYSEVQLKIKTKTKKCFVNAHCSCDCPNAEYEMADDKYGYGIAEDMGLAEISCKQCHYNSGRCDDCLFEHSKECPEYKESEDDD